jgi:hypothetical protein
VVNPFVASVSTTEAQRAQRFTEQKKLGHASLAYLNCRRFVILFAHVQSPCLFLAIAIVFVSSLAGYAQRAADPTDRRNPVMTSDRIDANKDTLYSLFSENRKSPGPAQQRRAYEAAKEYVRRFGDEKDVYSKETKKFVNDYEKGALEYQLVNAFNAKDYAKSFEVGRTVFEV